MIITLSIHPFFQIIAILISLYVWKEGFNRFLRLHINKPKKFNWKLHVRLGILVLTIWFIGIVGGLLIVKRTWHAILITGIHGKIGISILPFIIFAFISGYYLNSKKKKRKILPFVHGLLNTIMLLLILIQIYSGILIYKTFILGIE